MFQFPYNHAENVIFIALYMFLLYALLCQYNQLMYAVRYDGRG